MWIDSVVSPRIWWGLSFSSELWWGVIHWDMSLEYERRNKGSKVSSMAFIQSFLDWDILWLSFPPQLPHPCWWFEASCDCLPVSEAIPALALLLSLWMGCGEINPELSQTTWCRCVKVGGGGGFEFTFIYECRCLQRAPIDMLRRWHTNHRARGCHLSCEVTGRGGQSRQAHTHTHRGTHVCPAPTDNYLHEPSLLWQHTILCK